MTTAILAVAGYICGSMPWGLWLVRLFRGADIRTRAVDNVHHTCGKTGFAR